MTDDDTDQIDALLAAIADLAQVPAEYKNGYHDDHHDGARRPRLPRIANAYGKQLTSFGEGAAQTVEACPEAFTQDSGLGDRLRENSAEYIALRGLRGRLTRLLRGVTYRMGQVNNRLCGDIARTVNIRDATLNNVGADPQVRDKMDRGSALLQQLRRGRADTISSKAAAAKATGGALLRAHTTIGQQKVRIKYLNGQPLTPDDVIIQPPQAPAPRNKRRRHSATTSPPPATATPAAGPSRPARRRPVRPTPR